MEAGGQMMPVFMVTVKHLKLNCQSKNMLQNKCNCWRPGKFITWHALFPLCVCGKKRRSEGHLLSIGGVCACECGDVQVSSSVKIFYGVISFHRNWL